MQCMYPSVYAIPVSRHLDFCGKTEDQEDPLAFMESCYEMSDEHFFAG